MVNFTHETEIILLIIGENHVFYWKTPFIRRLKLNLNSHNIDN